MKRRVWAAASAAMMATTAFGAQAVLADKYPNGQVKVFNWGEYIDEDLIDEFEDEYGIEVIHDTQYPERCELCHSAQHRAQGQDPVDQQWRGR